MTVKTKRPHQPHWKDSTSAERQQKRLDAKNEIARAAGYKSWSAYETAVINKQTEIYSSSALDTFTQVIRNQIIETSDGNLVAIPYKQTWREMMVWIRDNFPPTRPA